MFRSVPRKRLDARDDVFIEGPQSTKYSPIFSYIHVPISKKIDFGDKGEQETLKQVKHMKNRN